MNHESETSEQRNHDDQEHTTNTIKNHTKNTNRRNILSKQFNEFGSYICASRVDGKFYCCQLFRQVDY